MIVGVLLQWQLQNASSKTACAVAKRVLGTFRIDALSIRTDTNFLLTWHYRERLVYPRAHVILPVPADIPRRYPMKNAPSRKYRRRHEREKSIRSKTLIWHAHSFPRRQRRMQLHRSTATGSRRCVWIHDICVPIRLATGILRIIATSNAIKMLRCDRRIPLRVKSRRNWNRFRLNYRWRNIYWLHRWFLPSVNLLCLCQFLRRARLGCALNA